METIEKHYKTQLTEGRPEFIREKESIENSYELLEIDISIVSMKNGKSSRPDFCCCGCCCCYCCCWRNIKIP